MSAVEFQAAPGELIPTINMVAEAKGRRLHVALTAPAVAPENWPKRVTHEGVEYAWVTRDVCPKGYYGAAIYREVKKKPEASPPPTQEIVEVTFEIAAGKYDGEDINWKYIDSFPTFEEAKSNYDMYVIDYPVREFNIVCKYADGRYKRTCVFSGEVRE